MVAVATAAGLLVLARKFSHRLVAASLVLRVYKLRRCGAVGRKNSTGFVQVWPLLQAEYVCG
jgi:hypothetical protein